MTNVDKCSKLGIFYPYFPFSFAQPCKELTKAKTLKFQGISCDLFKTLSLPQVLYPVNDGRSVKRKTVLKENTV